MSMILDTTMSDSALDVCRHPAPFDTAPAAAVVRRDARPACTQVETTRFGKLQVQPDLVLTFPGGVIGLEQCRRFIVVRHDDNGAFRWLQSLEQPHVAFPIVEPDEFCLDYAPTITDADARLLEIGKNTPILLFTIVTVPPRDPRDMTANLLAPLVINGVTRRGRQVIVLNEGYTTRHKIVDEVARKQANLAATPRAV